MGNERRNRFKAGSLQAKKIEARGSRKDANTSSGASHAEAPIPSNNAPDMHSVAGQASRLAAPLNTPAADSIVQNDPAFIQPESAVAEAVIQTESVASSKAKIDDRLIVKDAGWTVGEPVLKALKADAKAQEASIAASATSAESVASVPPSITGVTNATSDTINDTASDKQNSEPKNKTVAASSGPGYPSLFLQSAGPNYNDQPLLPARKRGSDSIFEFNEFNEWIVGAPGGAERIRARRAEQAQRAQNTTDAKALRAELKKIRAEQLPPLTFKQKWQRAGLLLLPLCIGALGIGFVIEGNTSYQQSRENAQIAEARMEMLTEQARLVDKGWATSRYVGSFEPTEGGDRSPWGAVGTRVSIGDDNSGPILQLFAGNKASQKADEKGIFNRQLAIFPGFSNIPAEEKAYFTMDNMKPAKYRQMEANVLFFEKNIKIKADPSTWPTEVSQVGRVLSEKMNARTEFTDIDKALTSLPAGPQRRLEWLYRARLLAFTDAYSILTKAIDGEDAFKQEALNLNMVRMVGWKSGTYRSSLDMIGSEYNIDMASFMAGQLPASELVKLNQKEILELSNRIADASMAWMVARQGPLIGFFNEEGASWWLKLASEAHLSEAEAKGQWNEWKAASSGNRPAAAFKGHEWDVGGVTWRTQGLPNISSESQWRFDGGNGVYAIKRFVDRNNDPERQVADKVNQRIYVETVMLYASEYFKVKQSVSNIESDQWGKRVAAGKGPLWTQWAMASYLKLDPYKEVDRFTSAFGDDYEGTTRLAFKASLISTFNAEYRRHQRNVNDLENITVPELSELSAVSTPTSSTSSELQDKSGRVFPGSARDAEPETLNSFRKAVHQKGERVKEARFNTISTHEKVEGSKAGANAPKGKTF